MQISSRMLIRTAIVILGVMLALGLYLSVSATDEASALNTSEWQKVAGYIDSYISGQYNPANDGEAGFTIDAATLKSRLDSNGDNIYLGEGDDAAGAPILVDVLSGYSTWIPATSLRVNWNSTAASTSTVNTIAAKVAAHENAGFSTDIITYCLTGHTESVVAGAYGAISQAGGFGGTTPPAVLGLKWGRYGWGTGSHGYGNTKNITASTVTPGTNSLATNANCTGASPDSELVRCTAAQALSVVGAGPLPWAASSDGSYQPVDLRSSINSTMANQTTGGAYAIQDPLQTLFSSAGGYANLAKINPSGGKVFFTNRTQHTAGIAAVSARMLGYNATFAKWGLPQWNNTIGEKYTGGAGYPVGAYTIDTVAPTITAGPTASAGATSATISRTTSEPATTKVEYGTTSGGPYTTTVNDTVLHANNTVTLNGLTPGVTYYAVVTVCDGQANCTVSSEVSFTTTCTSGKPVLTPLAPSAYWASMADYTNGVLTVDWPIRNDGTDSAYNVQLTSSSANNGVTLASTMPVSVGTIAASGTGTATVKYNIPTGVGSFHVSNMASADDQCGNTYTYP